MAAVIEAPPCNDTGAVRGAASITAAAAVSVCSPTNPTETPPTIATARPRKSRRVMPDLPVLILVSSLDIEPPCTLAHQASTAVPGRSLSRSRLMADSIRALVVQCYRPQASTSVGRPPRQPARPLDGDSWCLRYVPTGTLSSSVCTTVRTSVLGGLLRCTAGDRLACTLPGRYLTSMRLSPVCRPARDSART